MGRIVVHLTGKRPPLVFEANYTTEGNAFLSVVRQENPKECSYTTGLFFKTVHTYIEYDHVTVAKIRIREILRIEENEA